MDELKQRIAKETNPYAELFNYPQADTRPKPVDVHIILFNPETDNEGMHTIEYPKGSGRNVILAFESKQECDAFAGQLKDQQFFDPSVSITVLYLSFSLSSCIPFPQTPKSFFIVFSPRK